MSEFIRNAVPVLVLVAAAVGITQPAGQPAAPDPQMKAVLDELAALSPKPLETLTPTEARKQPTPADAVKALLEKHGKPTDPESVGSVKDLSIPGPAGLIPARVYTPKGSRPFPVVVYWHGGGWVIADLDTYDASARALCNAAGCVVVSCHYQQAPEHPFPAAAEDASAAYQWVLGNAGSFGGDPKKIAVCGESAGGNLAAVTAIRARDMGVQMPAHQVLVYPVTDQNYETPSYREHANARPLNKAMMQWFWGHYLAKPVSGTPFVAAPMKAPDLRRLPPTTIITADIDPLRSDGQMYADRLRQAGVPVTAVNFEGVTHEFFGMGAVVDKAKQAVAKAAEGLKSAFGK